MASKKRIDSIRKYFTDNEWTEMPDFTKQRYANLKENYDLMIKLGKKLRRQEGSLLRELGGLAVRTAAGFFEGAKFFFLAPDEGMWIGDSPKVIDNDCRTLQTSSSWTKFYSHDQKLLVSSQDPPHVLSSAQELDKSLPTTSHASMLSQDHANSEEVRLAPQDDSLFCDDCEMSYPGDCPLHGPLNYVKDTPVPSGDLERATKSVPDCLVIRRTTRRGTGHGVYAKKPLPKRLCFGPYEGAHAGATLMGLISQKLHHGRAQISTEGLGLGQSNWMRYVNSSSGEEPHNLVAFQRAGAVYYRTCKAIGTYEELLVSFRAPESEQEPKTADKTPTARLETLQERLQGPASRGAVSCEACGERFSCEEYLLRHKLRRHAAKQVGKYKCSHCDYSSNAKITTAQHEWSHTGDRPFTCEICQMSFSWQTSLYVHLATHTKEKPFECSTCGQRFTCSSHLQRHQRVHSTNARPFVCPACERGYARRDYLKIHLRTHTVEKPYACGACGRRFTDRSNAKRHEMCVHAKKFPLSCPHCAKGFASRSEVRRHVIAHHERHGDK